MKIELHDISKQFGTVLAADRVSLTVEAGSIHGVLGENGAGKSTLVKILSGFIPRDRGSIHLNGQEVDLRTPADAMRAGIGMLHQDPLDFPPLSVLDNFLVGRSGGWWLNRDRSIRQFRHLAEQLQFDLDPNGAIGRLTVGERQQVEILRLLSLGVNTLILDEPTTGISTSQKEALFAAARQLANQGKSIIFVSHKLEDVNQLCDRVTVMRQGRIVGHLPIPAADEQLIELIFGRELALPVKPPTRQDEIALQLHHVTVAGDRLRLKVDNLTVHQGEVVGLAGLEGNGQQLLLQLCAGLRSPLQGRVHVNHRDLTHRPYQDFLRWGVGYLPADRLREGLISGLSIHEHVALTAPQTGWLVNWHSTLRYSQDAIARFNIRGRPQSQVEQLSGGNQQRTQLALLPIPLNLVLLEHPTRGLDIESTLWVWQQLIARCEGGTAILFMSSDLDEIMQYSDRVMVFSGGAVSDPIPASELTVDRLGQLISGRLKSHSSAPLVHPQEV